MTADGAENPMVRIKSAPESAVALALQQQHQQQQQQLLQQQLLSQQMSLLQAPSQQQPQQPAPPPQLYQSLLQSPRQLLLQDAKLNRPSSAPERPQIAFGHKADWDFSTGSKKAEGQVMGKANGKPVKLTGQALALLGSVDWGHLRTEVPVNRHVTMEHAQQCLCSASPAERQTSPQKGRLRLPITPDRSQSPDVARPGNLAAQGPPSLQPLQSLTYAGQAHAGSPGSSPRSLSPNSYLARSGKLNPSSAQPHSSSLSRPGKMDNNGCPHPSQRDSSSPLLVPAADGQLAAQSACHSKRPRSRGRSSSAWQNAVEEMRKMGKSKPSFMQGLRSHSLSPHTQDSRGKTANKPVWQQYQRHVTPDRSLARPAPIKRVFQGLSRSASGRHDQQGRAFWRESPEAVPSGHEHVINHAPTITAQPVKKKSALRTSVKKSVDLASAPAGVPWSPAGKAPPPRASQAAKPLQIPASSSARRASQDQLVASNLGALASQPCPFRAGQQALAALLTKQAAWEHTRSTSLPPVLSQVTTMLQCKSEPLQCPPSRSATELVLAADPQLGQQASQSATAVECERQDIQSGAIASMSALHNAAVVELVAERNMISQDADVAGLDSSHAQIVQPGLKPSSSSRTFKPQLTVSFAEQIRLALELEAQSARRDTAPSRGKYFQDAGYFQEAARAVGNPAGAEAEDSRLKLEVREEAGVRGEPEEGIEADAIETLCDAGER